MIGQQKNNIIPYHQNYYLIKKPVNHFLKSRCKKKKKHNSELFHLWVKETRYSFTNSCEYFWPPLGTGRIIFYLFIKLSVKIFYNIFSLQFQFLFHL